MVDFEDFLVLADRFGKAGNRAPEDFTGGVFVLFEDFLILAAKIETEPQLGAFPGLVLVWRCGHRCACVHEKLPVVTNHQLLLTSSSMRRTMATMPAFDWLHAVFASRQEYPPLCV